MKTAKVILVAMVLVFTAVSISSADGIKEKPKYKVVNLTIAQAMYVPGLPQTMLLQLNEQSLLGCGCQAEYTADVTYQNVLYKITGTQQQWVVFFNWAGIIIGNDNNIIFKDN